jgi:hypothetical protein
MRAIAAYVGRHHIGLLALFVALGGTAYAVVAPNNSVVSKSIRDGQVRQQDVKLTKTVVYPALVRLQGAGAQLDPQGPFNVNVPPSGLVSVFAQTEIKKTVGAASDSCFVSLKTGSGGSSNGLYSDTSAGSNFTLKRTSPGTSGDGVSNPAEAGAITYLLDPGVHQFELTYGAFSNMVCDFQNTKLVVIPLP